MYNLRKLSASSDAFDYTKHEDVFLLFALLTIPQSVGVIMSVLLIVGVLKKRSELMLPSIVYNWILIWLYVIIIIVQVICTNEVKNLRLLLGPGEFNSFLWVYCLNFDYFSVVCIALLVYCASLFYFEK